MVLKTAAHLVALKAALRAASTEHLSVGSMAAWMVVHWVERSAALTAAHSAAQRAEQMADKTERSWAACSAVKSVFYLVVR